MSGNKRKLVWIDMDGVLCDFKHAYINELYKNPSVKYPQSQFGFFSDLTPMPGAIESYKILSESFDVRILTRPSPMNIACYSEKAYWVKKHLGFDAQTNMVISCDKSIVKGDFLIDDDTRAKQEDFEGKFIHFGGPVFNNWRSVMFYFSRL